MDADLKMLEYAPSVVAVAAVWTILEEKAALEENLGKIMTLFGQEHKVKSNVMTICSYSIIFTIGIYFYNLFIWIIAGEYCQMCQCYEISKR